MHVQTGLLGAKRWNSTAEHLRRLYDHGWDIGTHTISHASLGYLNEEAVEHEIRKSTQDMLDLGFERSARHFAYPQSSFSDTTLKVVKRHCDTARYVTGKLGPKQVAGDDLYRLDCISMKASEPSSKAIDFMHQASAQGKVAHIMFEMIFHKDVPPQGYPYAGFVDILDEAARMRDLDLVDVITLSAWYDRFAQQTSSA